MGRCIEHSYSPDKYGYGRTTIKYGAKFRGVLVHRLVYAKHIGVDVFEMGGVVMHSCDNPRCINVEHLSLGTHQDNMADMTSKGRQSKGSHRPCAKLTREDVLQIQAAEDKQADIAARYGIAQSHVSRLRNRKQWRA